MLDIVQYLIQKGADVNQCTKSNESPLFGASSRGYVDVVKLLVQRGAVVNQCNTNDQSSLHKASEGGYFNVVEYLVDQGARVNQQNTDEETSLFKASRNGHLNVVEYLVQNGADVNQCNKDKKTPLYNAVKIRHLNMVKFLIENKADLTVRTNDYISPLKLAIWSHYSEIATELIRIENHSIPFSANHHLLNILIDIRKTDVYVTDEVVHDGVGTVEKHPLSNYVLHCTDDQLEHLFKLGLNVNQCNNKGQSLLNVLIESQKHVSHRCRKVQLFLQNGADLTIRDCHILSILEKTRQIIKQSKEIRICNWRPIEYVKKIGDQKQIMQSLKKFMRRNSL